jgi:ABC-2 type transport system permease protein
METGNTTLDLSRWREKPRGIDYRRRTIVIAGLKELWATKLFKLLLSAAWFGGLMIAVAGFTFSQSIATGGWLETYATNFGPRAEAVVSAFGAFVLLYPDICIHGLFTLIFWLHSYLGLFLSLVALTVIVPRLITRDRASNALIVYLSRPLTSLDYLLGKLGIIVSVLLLLWTGPLVAGWLVSMLLAPDRDFIQYSISPLLRALAFNGISLVALAAIALGVSAVGRSSRIATIVWLGLWLILGAVSKPPPAPDWIKRASFSHDLSAVRQEVFRLDSALTDAGAQLPLISKQFAKNLTESGKAAEPVDFSGAIASLAAFSVLSSVVFLRKLRPE